MNTLNDALKPCPFCGGEAVQGKNHCSEKFLGISDREAKITTHVIHCLKCGTEQGYRYTDFTTPELAIAAWNTRANTPESSAAQGARVNEALGKAIEQTCNVIREVGKNEYDKDELDDICNQVYLVFGRAVPAGVAQPSDATAQPMTYQIEDCGCDGKERFRIYDQGGNGICYAQNRAQAENVVSLLANTAQGKPDVLMMAKWIVSTEFRKDHACAECEGTIVIPGFKCGYHIAQDIIALAAKKG